MLSFAPSGTTITIDDDDESDRGIAVQVMPVPAPVSARWKNVEMGYWIDFKKIAQKLTADEAEKIRAVCFDSFIRTSSGHWMPMIPNRIRKAGVNRPPRATILFRGKTYYVNRRQLVLWLKLVEEGRAHEWGSEERCVTICGQRLLCIEPSHLNLEDVTMNYARIACHEDRICRGHRGFPKCILSGDKSSA